MEDARRGSRQPNHVHEGSMADRTESLGAAGTVVTGGGVQCTEHIASSESTLHSGICPGTS